MSFPPRKNQECGEERLLCFQSTLHLQWFKSLGGLMKSGIQRAA
jgi:hypothetical protein